MAIPDAPKQELLHRLRDEVGVPAGEDERLDNVIDYARGYVVPAIGDAEVAMNVYIDCVVACAADLYNSRNARFGVLNAGTDGLDAVRISNDPLYSVWPKLKAAGVLTGRQVIA